MAALPSKYLSSIASVVPFFRTCLVLTLFFDPLRWGSDPYTLAWIGVAIATDFYLGWSCTETSVAVANKPNQTLHLVYPGGDSFQVNLKAPARHGLNERYKLLGNELMSPAQRRQLAHAGDIYRKVKLEPRRRRERQIHKTMLAESGAIKQTFQAKTSSRLQRSIKVEALRRSEKQRQLKRKEERASKRLRNEIAEDDWY